MPRQFAPVNEKFHTNKVDSDWGQGQSKCTVPQIAEGAQGACQSLLEALQCSSNKNNLTPHHVYLVYVSKPKGMSLTVTSALALPRSTWQC